MTRVGKAKLIGYALGIVVVIVIALWMGADYGHERRDTTRLPLF
jgi:hypothetical protein